MGANDWVDEGGIDEPEYDKDVIVGDFDTIPVIDVDGILSDDLAKRREVAEKVRDACMRVGFFYIENHGIPEQLVQGAFEWARKFFSLPFEKKMEVYIDNQFNFRGYTPLHGSGRPGPDGKGNANEAFDWGHSPKLNDDPDEQFRDPYMRGENVWPTDMSGFEAHLSTYYRTLRAFCRSLAKCMALSLHLPETFFDPYITHPGCSAVLAHYPPQTKDSASRGLDAHTDAECKHISHPPISIAQQSLTQRPEVFTVLAPGSVRALEVANRQGQWISAPPRPGTFIVNVGDQLQAMTNNFYVSTRHRVMNYTGQERYSIPFFFSANWETVIQPLPELVAQGDDGKQGSGFPHISAGKMYKDMMIALHRVSANNPELVKWRRAFVQPLES